MATSAYGLAELPAKVTVAPNSPSALAHASTGTCRDCRSDGRNRHRGEHPSRRGAVHLCDFGELDVHLPERCFDREDKERQRDEKLGEDDPRGAEGQLDTEVGEPLAHHSPASEGKQESDAPNHGWQHDRQQQSARTTRVVTPVPVESSQANGKPNSTQSAVAESEVISESPSADLAASLVSAPPRSLHGSRQRSANNGAPSTIAGTAAIATTQRGGRFLTGPRTLRRPGFAAAAALPRDLDDVWLRLPSL